MNYIKRKSQKQEKLTAKEFGGETQLASGALTHLKGDVRTGGFNIQAGKTNEFDFLIENKFTDKNYYILHEATWNKINKEAIRDNLRIPLMQIDIQDLSLVVMDLNDFKAFNYIDNLAYKEFNLDITAKSVRLKLVDISKMIDKAHSEMDSPLINLNFKKNKLNLIVIEKSNFLYLKQLTDK